MLKTIGMVGVGAFLAAVALSSAGCASKLVKIDSDPGLARIYVNDAYVGKTPLYYRFRDRWQPWPIERTDDYTVKAQFDSGAVAEEKTFTETSDWPEIDYIPEEIFFTPVGQSAGPGGE